jgi:hypothetical protein
VERAAAPRAVAPRAKAKAGAARAGAAVKARVGAAGWKAAV